jgi:hypothetical protein
MTAMKKERMTAMKIVKLLMYAYIVGMAILLLLFFFMAASVIVGVILFFFLNFLIFFNAVTSIAGVILFFYLWRTQQIEISRDIFFLLPHILLSFGLMGPIGGFWVLPENWTGSFDDVWSVAYAINQYGMPFLLYCFLQVTGGFYVIGARVYCFVLPVFTMFGIAARAG